MSKSPFKRTSSFDQPEPKGPPPPPTPGQENITLSPTQKLARQQLKDSGPDVERWYQMVVEWSHSTSRFASTDVVMVPRDEIEELRDELYSRLH